MKCAWNNAALGCDNLLIELQPGYACGDKEVADGVVHLRMNNVTKEGIFDTALLRRIPRHIAERQGRFAQAGDVIFVNTNSTELVGKSMVFPGWREPCAFSNHLTRLRVNPEILDPVWLHLCFRKLWHEGYFAANCIEFIGQSTFNKQQLLELNIPVPPLAEQRRLVARIEVLTGRLEQARQARQAALTEAGACLRAAVVRAFTAPDEDSVRSLGEVTGIIGGNSIPEHAPAPGEGEERIALMKVSDMNAPGNERFIAACRLETNRTAALACKLRIVPAGAVVFPKRGGAIATNKKRVLGIPAALDPNMMGVYPLPASAITSDFLFWWFESLDLAELQDDGGIPQVNKKHLDPLQIPVLPKPEQRAIVSRLNALRAKLDELQRLQRETEAELASVTPALLAKAFRGEL